MMAGERLGIPPLRLREGLENGSLRDKISRLSAFMTVDPMAPERSWPGYALTGSVQPPESYGG